MAKTALDHLLSYALYEKCQHPKQRTWDKFVYDEEVLHYGLLSMFLKASPGFAKDFLQLRRRPRVHAVMPPYSDHPFDLEIRTASQIYYAEVKTWSRLTANQLSRQTAHLRDRGATGIYVMTDFQGWTDEQIAAETGARARLFSFEDVHSSIRSHLNELGSPAKQVGQSYVKVLAALCKRTKDAA